MSTDPLALFREWVPDPFEVALATATPDGRPSLRLVLLKSADEQGFTFFTGYSSRKGRELEANPRAALLFHREGLQVRVEGPVERVPDEESDAYWASRPAGSRRSAAASHQSEPIGSREELEAAVAAQPAEPPRPERWGGYRLVPDTYEFWRHRDDRLHERHSYRARARRLGGGTAPTMTPPRLFAAAALALLLACAASAASGSPTIGGCPLFPATSPWNERVDGLPVAADSATLIASIGNGPVHADFGSGLWDGSRIGIPYVVVHGKTTPKSRPSFEYADESDKGPYPIPANVPIEGQPKTGEGDRHALIVDRDSCRLYELYALQGTGTHWTAGSGAIWSLRSNALRPAGWTSADAAGLPILPGLARWDGDAATGVIRHALRFTVERTRRAYVYPARHYASDATDPSLPPMGLRVRLKASVDISKLPPQARIVAQAMKTYGLILADNGSNWYVSGAPSPHWSNAELHALGGLTGSDFEVVDTSKLRP